MLFDQSDPLEPEAPASPRWLWTARGAAGLSLLLLGIGPLTYGLASRDEAAVAAGILVSFACGVVLLFLSFRRSEWAFGAGLRMGILVGMALLVPALGALVGAGGRAGGGAALFAAMVGVPQVVLIAACVRLSRRHPRRGRLVGYLLGVVLVFGLVLAAMAPRLGQHPPRHDAVNLGDLRSFASAEAYYSARNVVFGSPACLVRPVGCIPGYTRDEPVFFGPEAPAVRSPTCACFTPGRR